MPAAEELPAAGALLAAEGRDEPVSLAEGTGEAALSLLACGRSNTKRSEGGDQLDRVMLVPFVDVGSAVPVPAGVVVVFVAFCAETATTAAAARRAVVKRIVLFFFGCLALEISKATVVVVLGEWYVVGLLTEVVDVCGEGNRGRGGGRRSYKGIACATRPALLARSLALTPHCLAAVCNPLYVGRPRSANRPLHRSRDNNSSTPHQRHFIFFLSAGRLLRLAGTSPDAD